MHLNVTWETSTNIVGILGRNISEYIRNATENASFLTLDVYNDLVFQNNLLLSFIYILLLMIIGISGNLLVCYIYIFYQKKSQSTTRSFQGRNKSSKLKTTDIFIISLACFDLISCLIAMPMELTLLRNFLTFDHPLLCKLSRAVSMFCTISTSFVLLAIAVSRFVGIRLRSINIKITTFHAKIIVIVSVLFAVALSSPVLVLYGTYTFPLTVGVSASTCLITNEYAETDYPFITIVCLSAFHLFFDILFITFYGLISGKVVRNKRTFSTIIRNNSSNRSQGQSIESKTNSLVLSNEGNQNENVSLTNTASDKTKCDDVFLNHIGEDSNENGQQCPALNKRMIKPIKINKRKKSSSTSTGFSRRSCKSLRKGSSYSNETNVHGRTYKASRTTFMLFIVTLAFMVTFAPYCIVALLRNLEGVGYYSKLTDIQKTVYQLFLRSYFLSSAINPIIYSFLNQSFKSRSKTILKKIFNSMLCLKQ
ncbi:probable G-protein coupled receptor No9 [Mytilus californianus]|uniref:probable G-protein coupled receptor No9 n=1 Tax=Mytilus californianus TaxID=6549 RepID=UPI002247E6EF|nr:probable G-protein coupled receptor No9 [Mytilus californianus]XP_052086008.1 probable G-protein coupled receptor No9 [Mytilus californianus]